MASPGFRHTKAVLLMPLVQRDKTISVELALASDGVLDLNAKTQNMLL